MVGHDLFSYVLPLNYSPDIEHPRDLIARGPTLAGLPMIAVKATCGSDGINRNHLDPRLATWSWHVEF
jgi:hypothetical protein